VVLGIGQSHNALDGSHGPLIVGHSVFLSVSNPNGTKTNDDIRMIVMSFWSAASISNDLGTLRQLKIYSILV